MGKDYLPHYNIESIADTLHLYGIKMWAQLFKTLSR